jgi:hypothetical protein
MLTLAEFNYTLPTCRIFSRNVVISFAKNPRLLQKHTPGM